MSQLRKKPMRVFLPMLGMQVQDCKASMVCCKLVDRSVKNITKFGVAHDSDEQPGVWCNMSSTNVSQMADEMANATCARADDRGNKKGNIVYVVVKWAQVD